MIRSIHGKALISGNEVVIDVNGVGYLVFMRPSDVRELPHNAEVTLHTYLAVREDALNLYGFLSRDDLAMFELLIELPKIGPKSALAILAQANIELLQKAVSTDDPAYLSKMSGLGRKTAEKIVQGLKDKLGSTGDAGGTHGMSDVIDALLALGYSEREARDAAQRLSPELQDTNTRVKEALKLLSR